MTILRKIISGGQTGADQGALDAAIALGIEHGGTCPAGRRSEAGPIPFKYQLKSSSSDSYEMRTRINVHDADATLVVSFRALSKLDGGSQGTVKIVNRQAKPWLHLQLNSGGTPSDAVVREFHAWLVKWAVGILNVAGPRESKEPGLQKATCQALMKLLEHVHPQPDRGASPSAPPSHHPHHTSGVEEDGDTAATTADRPAPDSLSPQGFTERVRVLASDLYNPSLREVNELIEEFYRIQGNGAGGSLHIVLDDGNTEEEHVEFCREYARKNGDQAGFWLAQLLLRFTDDERAALYGGEIA